MGENNIKASGYRRSRNPSYHAGHNVGTGVGVGAAKIYSKNKASSKEKAALVEGIGHLGTVKL